MFRKPGEPRIDSRRDPRTGSAGRIHEATEPRAERDGFVVFSDDWGGHPSSCQHIFSRIAAEHRVVWINTVGMRRPRLTRSDLAKAFGKVGRMWHTASAAPRDERLSNLSACQPLMLPFSDVYGIVSPFRSTPAIALTTFSYNESAADLSTSVSPRF